MSLPLTTSYVNAENEISANAAEITRLQAEVAQLRATNSNISQELSTLKEESVGKQFSRFNDLPVEIRCTIWKLALSAAQIHIIRRDFHSRSAVNIVMAACQEAREQGNQLQLPYYRMLPLSKASNQDGGARNYIGSEGDMLWVPGFDSMGSVQQMVKFFCPKCPDWEDTPRWSLGYKPPPNCHSIRLKGLIVDDQPCPEMSLGMNRENNPIHHTMLEVNFQKLYIVVNPTSLHFRDSVLVKPTSRSKPPRSIGTSKSADWDVYDATKTRELESMKLNLHACWPEWQVPTVQYVEIESASVKEDWIVHKPENLTRYI